VTAAGQELPCAGSSVLCLVEQDAGGVADPSARALTFARGLAGAGTGGRLGAVVFAAAGQVPAQALSRYGVTEVHLVAAEAVPGYAPLAWARTLAGLAAQAGAGSVVAAGTDRGHEVMAHLGALTGLPVAANCVAAERVSHRALQVTRHRWAGLLLEDALLEASPALLTVAAEAVPAVPVDSPPPAVHSHRPDLAPGDLRVRAAESPRQGGGSSLASARVVVGAGRGVGGPDGFAPLEELASLLGGVVGVSRAVTSEGWRPHRQQIGQTGTRITPELYLACGISGAIQHMAGCTGAKHIVAINTDPQAPIMNRADYAVIGDLTEIVPALVAALRDRSRSPA
jgi:electron transfer flavoprotein alpha subunit